jgi:hypothetical protein
MGQPRSSIFSKFAGKSLLFVLAECFRLNEYLKLNLKFSYLHTKDDVEIDLIVERPGNPDLLVEI